MIDPEVVKVSRCVREIPAVGALPPRSHVKWSNVLDQSDETAAAAAAAAAVEEATLSGVRGEAALLLWPPLHALDAHLTPRPSPRLAASLKKGAEVHVAATNHERTACHR